MEILPTPRYPDVEVVAPDADDDSAAMVLYTRALHGLQEADVDDEELDEFTDEVMRADVDETAMQDIVARWVTVDRPDGEPEEEEPAEPE